MNEREGSPNQQQQQVLPKRPEYQEPTLLRYLTYHQKQQWYA